MSLASLAAGAVVRSRNGAQRARKRPEQRVEKQLHQYVLFVAAPVWIAAGLLDYLWRRKTRIETTTGPEESWLHLLMLAEAAPIALAPLLFEINGGVLLLMAGMFAAHEAAAAWDVSMTAPRRLIETTEQHIHGVLEMMPSTVASLYVATHWDKLRAILHHPRAAQIAGLVSAITLFDFAPHAEELWRCWAAEQKGLTGRDSPECAAVLYGKKGAALTSSAALLPEPSSPPAVPVPSTPQTRLKAAEPW